MSLHAPSRFEFLPSNIRCPDKHAGTLDEKMYQRQLMKGELADAMEVCCRRFTNPAYLYFVTQGSCMPLHICQLKSC